MSEIPAASQLSVAQFRDALETRWRYVDINEPLPSDFRDWIVARYAEAAEAREPLTLSRLRELAKPTVAAWKTLFGLDEHKKDDRVQLYELTEAIASYGEMLITHHLPPAIVEALEPRPAAAETPPTKTEQERRERIAVQAWKSIYGDDYEPTAEHIDVMLVAFRTAMRTANPPVFPLMSLVADPSGRQVHVEPLVPPGRETAPQGTKK